MMIKYLIVAFSIINIFTIVSASRNLLVLGGNGFLGSAFVHEILRRGDNVTLINRGNWYWDSRSRIKPHVTHLSCDRNKRLRECTEYNKLMAEGTNEEDLQWDAVIDFSGYTRDQVRDAVETVKGKTRLYIYISTDSVYDVCDPPIGEPVKEESAKRPDDVARKNMLNHHHTYAHEKLSAEEFLQEFRSEGGPPFVVLRLPDVIGPRDTTYRFWIYQMWIKLAPVLNDHPVSIPKFLVDYANSFVYVDDVAKLLERLTRTASLPGDIVDQVYNLAWKENITMMQLLRTVEQHLNISKQDFQILDDHSALYLYPTVRVGPVNVSKAIEKLDWSPTEFNSALKSTVEFNERVMADEKFKVQRDEIVQIVLNHLYSKDANRFYRAVEKLYSIDLGHFTSHDEL